VAENPSSASHPSRDRPFRHPNTRFLAFSAGFLPKPLSQYDLMACNNHFSVRKNDFYTRKNDFSAYKNDFHAP
jgi:hypothetical protein